MKNLNYILLVVMTFSLSIGVSFSDNSEKAFDNQVSESIELSNVSVSFVDVEFDREIKFIASPAGMIYAETISNFGILERHLFVLKFKNEKSSIEMPEKRYNIAEVLKPPLVLSYRHKALNLKNKAWHRLARDGITYA